jgi:transcriptional regulator with XRE-family HTH domain
MTALPYINMAKLSDDAIIAKIGNFVKQERLDQNMTQQQLSAKAGINRTTLSELELGRRCHLLTLIQVLRILNKLQILDVFEYIKPVSPMLLAEMEVKYYAKARVRNKKTSETKKKSDW